MFVAMSDMNITSRLDAYLTNVINPILVNDAIVFIPMGVKGKADGQLRRSGSFTSVQGYSRFGKWRLEV